MYGVLNPRADTQTVLIFRPDARLEQIGPEPLDVTVRSRDLTTGISRTWTDSVVRRGGSYRHVYWAPFRAKHDHTYRVTALPPKDSAATAVVTVPPRVEAEFDTTAGDISEVRVTVTAPGGVPSFLKPRIFIQTGLFSPPAPTPINPNPGDRAFTFPYGDRTRQKAGGWAFTFDLDSIWVPISAEYESLGDNIMVDHLDMRFLVASGEVTRELITADMDSLASRDVLSNVENGYGHIGALYRDTIGWFPPNEVRDTVGFFAPEPILEIRNRNR